MIYCWVELILQVTIVIKLFYVFVPILSSLILDGNISSTTGISTEIPSGNIKPIDTNLELRMSSLENDRES